MASSGKINIHGKEYLTVALRVANFREAHPDWSIITELVHRDADTVVMKASVACPPTEPFANGQIIGTGYAEEQRSASQINRTSALENCETSAIGRALAACGYGGTEYASANEVQNAIHQQGTSVAAAVLSTTPKLQIDNENIQQSEMSIRKSMYEYGREVIDAEGFKLSVKDAVFDLDAEHKIALWKRFDSKERALLKGVF